MNLWPIKLVHIKYKISQVTNIVYTHSLPAPFHPQPLQRMTAVFVNAHTHTHREKSASKRSRENEVECHC